MPTSIPCAGYIGHLFRKQASKIDWPILLAKNHEMNRQAECVILISCYRNLSNRQRRNSFCVSCSQPNEAIDPLLFSPAPPAYPEMDEALLYLTAARNGNRSCSRETRAGSWECPPPAPTHHPPSRDQTTDIHENGLTPAGTFGKGRSGLEANPLHVQPETLLKWHRQEFRIFWKRKSKPKSTQAKVAAETKQNAALLVQSHPRW